MQFLSQALDLNPVTGVIGDRAVGCMEGFFFPLSIAQLVGYFMDRVGRDKKDNLVIMGLTVKSGNLGLITNRDTDFLCDLRWVTYSSCDSSPGL